jgi:TatD DNase family protein
LEHSPYIDTHAHLLDERFDADRETTIARANEKNVRHIIEVSCDPAGWERALALTDERTGISCVLGIHPEEAQQSSPSVLTRLEDLARRDNVVGIGETGLDYYHETSPRDVQKDVFLATLRIAQKIQKPVVIHCRQAYSDLLELLASFGPLPAGVVHCFSGTAEEARQLLTRGFYLGVDGPATYPSAKALKEAIGTIPLDRLLLETDSPYLPPQDFRGKRNEPAYLPLIAHAVAALKNTTVEEVATVTTANAARLFHLKG